MKKILFFLNAIGPDYQCDSLLHGLLSLNDVSVDVCGVSPKRWIRMGMSYRDNPLWYMLHGAETSKLRRLYGKGFTLYGHLTNPVSLVNPFVAVDRTINGQYSTIIAGSIWRCSWLVHVAKAMSDAKIYCVDGEDWDYIHSTVAKCDGYYKRELTGEVSGKVRPISFAIPKQLVMHDVPQKVARLSPIVPGDLSTYIYNNERDYYNAYRQHIYGITHKKAGWDCLRHYEIAMNGCLPVMLDIDQCPPNTMVTTSRKIYSDAVSMYSSNDDSRAKDLTQQLLQHVRLHNTTEVLANYVMNG